MDNRHLRCIAALPQARAEARKKCIPRLQQAIDTNHFRKRKPLFLRWYTSRPCKHGTKKLSNHATKTQIIQLVTQN